MRPLVLLRYRAENVWTRSANASTIDDPPRLENSSSVDAYDVSVSTLTLDPQQPCHFGRIPALHPHETVALVVCIQPPERSLTAAISKHVVEDVLAGRPPVTRWPVKISYRDDEGNSYATCCEIRVVRLPLEIEAAAMSSSAPGPTSTRTATPSPAPPVGARC